jgi:hypothetical protein
LSYHAPGVDVAACVAAYREHVAANQDEAVALLRTLYSGPAKRPKGKKQQALVPVEANGEDDE